MARFLAEIEGQSGKAVHRLGSAPSGIRAQAQGWNVGVKVYGEPMVLGSDKVDIGDSFTVVVTGGSHASERERIALRVTRDASDGRIVVEFDPFDDFGAT